MTLVKERYKSVAGLLAAGDNVIDAVIMEDNFTLDAILAKLRTLEPDIIYLAVVDAKNKVVSSFDTVLVGKTFKAPAGHKVLGNEPILVGESNSGNIKQLHYALPIQSSGQKIAALYLTAKANPSLVLGQSAPIETKKSPLVLIVGGIFALLVGLITFAASGSMKGAILNKLVEEQQHLFSPKIAQLKKDQERTQDEIDELAKHKADLDTEVAAAQMTVVNAKKEYEAIMQQIAQHPITQSVEKLKAAEGELVRRLEAMKAELTKAAKDLETAKTEKETLVKSLDADRQEEKALHDRLDLIKKKILRLEG
jgi:F0F1-type ATP synthase membrane subunit b/b'